MANCEYRVTINQAGKNFVSEFADKQVRGAIVSARDPETQLCQVKIDRFDHLPVCELPDFSTEACPIAQFCKGRLSMEQTNQQLKTIFKL